MFWTRPQGCAIVGGKDEGKQGTLSTITQASGNKSRAEFLETFNKTNSFIYRYKVPQFNFLSTVIFNFDHVSFLAFFACYIFFAKEEIKF